MRDRREAPTALQPGCPAAEIRVNAHSSAGEDALREAEQLRDHLFPQVKGPIQFPEPSPVLDLASRTNSPARLFKHIHRSSMLHRENFCVGAQVKHLYLLDAYLALASSRNALGLYAISRSMFELNAFLHEVRDRLVAASARAAGDWRGAGQEFFGILVRARFGTTNPAYHELLRGEGVPTDRLKPFNVMNSIRQLNKHPEYGDSENRYATLSDFVHHNLGSATLANAGSATADFAATPGGGGMVMPGGGTLTQYEYPLPMKYESARDDTAPGFLRDARACVRWINEVPPSPYTTAQVEQFTGSRVGVPVLRAPHFEAPTKRPARNDPCPCGSGDKFKRCCGR